MIDNKMPIFWLFRIMAFRMVRGKLRHLASARFILIAIFVFNLPLCSMAASNSSQIDTSTLQAKHEFGMAAPLEPELKHQVSAWFRLLPRDVVESIADPIIKRVARAIYQGEEPRDEELRNAITRMIAVSIKNSMVSTERQQKADKKNKYQTSVLEAAPSDLVNALRKDSPGSEIRELAFINAFEKIKTDDGKSVRSYMLSLVPSLSYWPYKPGTFAPVDIKQTHPGTRGSGGMLSNSNDITLCGARTPDFFEQLPNGRKLGVYDPLGFPEAVRLTLDNSADTYCSGALISQDWVLTAAHCFFGKTSSNFSVIVSDDTGRSLNYNSSSILNNQIAIHDDYITCQQSFGQSPDVKKICAAHDIALAKLKHPLKVNVKSILNKAHLPNRFRGTMAGYGPNRVSEPGGGDHNISLDVGWPPVQSQNDRVTWGTRVDADKTNVDVNCHGDSGGAIYLTAWDIGGTVIAKPNEPSVGCGAERRWIVGVVSYIDVPNSAGQASACVSGDPMTGGGALVAPHLDWICKKTGLGCSSEHIVIDPS